jgi:hypothetical protein
MPRRCCRRCGRRRGSEARPGAAPWPCFLHPMAPGSKAHGTGYMANVPIRLAQGLDWRPVSLMARGNARGSDALNAHAASGLARDFRPARITTAGPAVIRPRASGAEELVVPGSGRPGRRTGAGMPNPCHHEPANHAAGNRACGTSCARAFGAVRCVSATSCRASGDAVAVAAGVAAVASIILGTILEWLNRSHAAARQPTRSLLGVALAVPRRYADTRASRGALFRLTVG